jgi:hypothetical protein
MAPAGIDSERLRRPAMADERVEAPCRRVRRLRFWLVFIDAKHMKSDMASELASVPHDGSVCYLFFPISEIHWPHWALFHPRRLVGARRNRNSAIQGCFPLLIQPNNRLPALLIRITGGPHEGAGFGPNGPHDQADLDGDLEISSRDVFTLREHAAATGITTSQLAQSEKK